MSDLFDFEFRRFVTPSLVSALYRLWVAVSGLALVVFVFGGLARMTTTQIEFKEFVPFLLAIGAALALFFLLLIAVRIALEAALVLFRIEENTRG